MNDHQHRTSSPASAHNIEEVMRVLGTSRSGLSMLDAQDRLRQLRSHQTAHTKAAPWRTFLIETVRNPLIMLLIALFIVTTLTGDPIAALMIAAMIVIGTVIRYVQENRSERAVDALRQLVRAQATVVRQGADHFIPVEDIVPGDIIRLSAGDLIPADVHLIESDDLHVDEHILTGESVPAEKSACGVANANPLDDRRLCFSGSTVQTGYAVAVATSVGADTTFGDITTSLQARRCETAFDIGIASFTMMMLRIVVILVPVIFLINGFLRGDWMEALLFATAVAVGITPEMLPMIITVNLSKGAIVMARRKVIVKHLQSIQNLGAMDVLCTDKTGTLTQGRIILMHHVRPDGSESEEVLMLGYLNSMFESGLRNIMDEAVLAHAHLEREVEHQQWIKLDEQPFDFERRRLSVLVQQPAQPPVIICKGALEEVLACCRDVPESAMRVADTLNERGFRVVAVATRRMPHDCVTITQIDETDMTLEGFLAFLDPPKDSATAALRELAESHITVKILSGDRLAVTLYVSDIVGLKVQGALTGPQIDAMSDEELSNAVESTTVFAKLTPRHKERVIGALRSRGHVVGFLGDGINDAPALRRADVGISVEEAVDIAKEASDIVLLERNLAVLHDGVIEGRRVFGNVIKYLRMAASSNVGNMLSVTGASILLPFLPMKPAQIMVNNLLYDISQTAIPADTVADAWLIRPRRWSMEDVRRTILIFGPISSFFDYVTYAVLLGPLHAGDNRPLFQTGWFVESLFSQTLIVYVLRSHALPWKPPFPAAALMITTLIILSIGLWLPISPIGSYLGFVALPLTYWGWLFIILATYLLCSLAAVRWLEHRR